MGLVATAVKKAVKAAPSAQTGVVRAAVRAPATVYAAVRCHTSQAYRAVNLLWAAAFRDAARSSALADLPRIYGQTSRQRIGCLKNTRIFSLSSCSVAFLSPVGLMPRWITTQNSNPLSVNG